MPSGGARKNTGVKKGYKQKRTIEREEKARIAADRERLLMVERAAGTKEEIIQAALAGKKLAKEVLDDFMNLFAGIAAYHQPYPKERGKNPNENTGKFLEYGALAIDAAKALVSYQSPRLSAVMVGAAVVTEIEVTGGLPDDQDGGLIGTVPVVEAETVEAEIVPEEKKIA